MRAIVGLSVLALPLVGMAVGMLVGWKIALGLIVVVVLAAVVMRVDRDDVFGGDMA